MTIRQRPVDPITRLSQLQQQAQALGDDFAQVARQLERHPPKKHRRLRRTELPGRIVAGLQQRAQLHMEWDHLRQAVDRSRSRPRLAAVLTALALAYARSPLALRAVPTVLRRHLQSWMLSDLAGWPVTLIYSLTIGYYLGFATACHDILEREAGPMQAPALRRRWQPLLLQLLLISPGLVLLSQRCLNAAADAAAPSPDTSIAAPPPWQQAALTALQTSVGLGTYLLGEIIWLGGMVDLLARGTQAVWQQRSLASRSLACQRPENLGAQPPNRQGRQPLPSVPPTTPPQAAPADPSRPLACQPPQKLGAQPPNQQSRRPPPTTPPPASAAPAPATPPQPAAADPSRSLTHHQPQKLEPQPPNQQRRQSLPITPPPAPAADPQQPPLSTPALLALTAAATALQRELPGPCARHGDPAEIVALCAALEQLAPAQIAQPVLQRALLRLAPAGRSTLRQGLSTAALWAVRHKRHGRLKNLLAEHLVPLQSALAQIA